MVGGSPRSPSGWAFQGGRFCVDGRVVGAWGLRGICEARVVLASTGSIHHPSTTPVKWIGQTTILPAGQALSCASHADHHRLTRGFGSVLARPGLDVAGIRYVRLISRTGGRPVPGDAVGAHLPGDRRRSSRGVAALTCLLSRHAWRGGGGDASPGSTRFGRRRRHARTTTSSVRSPRADRRSTPTSTRQTGPPYLNT